MEVTEFAIVDIETTGGYAAAADITEIAILIFNGEQVIDRYSSLVRPEHSIPPYIEALTGISNEMVAEAPLFKDIAGEVLSFLNGRVFVAHNVHFDYSFLQAALQKSGLTWKAAKLCTVRLSKHTFPNLPSYSLGKLCGRLGIPISNRHRAEGDATATAILFQRIFSADKEGLLKKLVKHHAKEQRLPTHISADVWDTLPHTTGIYQFWDRNGKIIYIGKAKNIRKRVLGHFTGNNPGQKRQQFINEITDITYEETGTEFAALLRECHLIKTHWPKHNRALKKYEPQFGLVEYEDLLGYRRLSVVRMTKHLTPLIYFSTVAESTQLLLQMIQAGQLERSLCQFYGEPSRPPASASMEKADNLPSPAVHNLLVRRAIDWLKEQKRSYMIVNPGRTPDEKCYVYVQEDQVYAMGFIAAHCQISNLDEFLEPAHRLRSNYYMNQLAASYAREFPQRVFPVKISAAVSLPPVALDPLENWIR